MPLISAIITGHREGLLAGPTIASFKEAVTHAHARGLDVEPIIVLDRPDNITRAVFLELKISDARIYFSDVGDPGQSRNRGVSEARGEYVTFLDGDDLWSFNWLGEAYKVCAPSKEILIAHSELDVAFGMESHIWVHLDSRAPDFDLGYLSLGNFWDALSFAQREVFVKFPFRMNDLAAGFGHEDWHWNSVTLSAGYAHCPIPGTVHFKRKRTHSQLSLCEKNDAVIWPTELAHFDVADRLTAHKSGAE